MTKRIAFVHTVGFLVEDFRARARADMPAADCFHILNESLLQDLLRRAPLPLVYRRVVDQIVLAAEARPDLIVVTCSSTSPAVDIARRIVPVPILKIDDPMMAEAARSGARIGLLCTASSTVEPSSALLRAHAADVRRVPDPERPGAGRERGGAFAEQQQVAAPPGGLGDQRAGAQRRPRRPRVGGERGGQGRHQQRLGRPAQLSGARRQ